MKWHKLVSLQILIALGLLIVIEICFRLFAPQVNKTLFVNGKPLAKRDDQLGYVLNPGSVTRHRFSEFDVTYMVNAQGFHQPHFVKADTLQKTILFLGDSYTFGMGTFYQDSYVGILNQNLPEGYTSINAGVLGYSASQELLMLQRLMPVYQPTLVCLEIVANDFQQVAGFTFNAEANLTNTNIKWNENQRWRLHSVDFAKRMVLKSDRLYYSLAKTQNEALHATIKDQVDTLSQIIGSISDLCKMNNCELIVFFYPTKFMVTQLQFDNNTDETTALVDERFAAVLQKNRHYYFNPLQAIAKDYSQTKLDHHYRIDGHCTAHGNAFLARILSEKIKQQWVVENSKTINLN